MCTCARVGAYGPSSSARYGQGGSLLQQMTIQGWCQRVRGTRTATGTVQHVTKTAHYAQAAARCAVLAARRVPRREQNAPRPRQRKPWATRQQGSSGCFVAHQPARAAACCCHPAPAAGAPSPRAAQRAAVRWATPRPAARGWTRQRGATAAAIPLRRQGWAKTARTRTPATCTCAHTPGAPGSRARTGCAAPLPLFPLLPWSTVFATVLCSSVSKESRNVGIYMTRLRLRINLKKRIRTRTSTTCRTWRAPTLPWLRQTAFRKSAPPRRTLGTRRAPTS